MNTEYKIIPICLPYNDTDFIKVSNIAYGIWDRDDETGRLTDTMKAEQKAIAMAANTYHWSGKLDFVYGVSTAGGIGDKVKSDKANKQIIEKLSRCTRVSYIRGEW
jgi:hypothetical protein